MKSNKTIQLKKYTISFVLGFLILFFSVTPYVFAEIDAAALNAILSQLGGGVTQTGSETETEPEPGPVEISGGINKEENTTNNPSSDSERLDEMLSNISGNTESKEEKANNSDVSNKIKTPSVEPKKTKDTSSKKPLWEDKKSAPPTPFFTKPSFQILKVEAGDKKATITFKVLNETSEIRKFEFLYADETGKSKKILTSEKEHIKNAKGEYVWYISDLEFTKYTVSISWINEKGQTVSGVVSKPFWADLSLWSAGKCIIPNVDGLRVLEKKDTSILYWDSIPEAIGYRVYKKNANGKYVFVQETKDDSYTIHITDGSAKYEEFSVKALCSDGTESFGFSPSTSVRTGPSEIVLLGIISILISLWVVQRKKIFCKL